MNRYRCPDSAGLGMTVIGCGQVFESEPDHEGLVDCPHCGIWFSPAIEPETVLEELS